MPDKLRFAVVASSSEEEDHPAWALAKHSPQSKGWMSAKWCEYPQQIILMFDGICTVHQLQVLSHSSKIATKIEIHLTTDPNAVVSPKMAKFQKLGYISFSDNKKSGLKARELKTVPLNRQAVMIKLVLHQNHVNDLNLFNQVGLVAVNAVGVMDKPLGLLNESQPSVDVNASVDLTQLRPRNVVEPSANLELDVNFDPTTAQQIRDLLHAKDRAVAEEDYDEARRLKDAIEYLRGVGKDLFELERAKLEAVRMEDYETAKDKKAAIQRLRNTVLQRISGQSPSAGGAGAARGMSPPARGAARGFGEPRRGSMHDAGGASDFGDEMRGASPERRMPPNAAPARMRLDDRPVGVAAARDLPPIDGPVENPDERPLPALARTGAQPLADDAPPPEEATTAVGDLPPPEPIPAPQMKNARPFIDAFGEHIAQCMFSKNWNLREFAVKEVSKKMSDFKTDSGFRLACQFLEFMLADRIAQVQFESFNFLNLLLDECVGTLKMASVHQHMDGVVAECVNKTGETNARVRDAALESLKKMARNSNVGVNFVAHYALRPVKNATQWRPIFGRLTLLKALIPEFSLQPSGMSLENVMTFVVAAFGSSNGQTRQEAADVTVECYKQVGPKVLTLLKTIKKQQLEMVEEAIAKADGKPAGAAPAATQPAASSGGPAASAAPKGRMANRASGANQAARSPRRSVAPAAGASAAAASSSEDPGSNELVLAEDPTLCQFCGAVNPDFANGEPLDEHLISQCPMLTSCPACQQMIEIASMTEHLVSECDHHERYKLCPRCKEAIPKKFFDSHVQKKGCKPAGDGHRCPLCHTNLGGQPEDWLAHLTNPESCKKNPRTQKKA